MHREQVFRGIVSNDFDDREHLLEVLDVSADNSTGLRDASFNQ